MALRNLPCRPVAGVLLLALMVLGRAVLAPPPAFAEPARSAAYQALDRKIKALYKAGRQREIVPLIAQRLELFDAEIGLETEKGAIELHWITKLYLEEGLYEQAIPVAKKLIRVREKVWGPRVQGTTLARQMLADSYRATGRLDAAEALYRQILEAQPAGLQRNRSHMAPYVSNLARVKLLKGQYQAALAQFRAAVAGLTAEFLEPGKSTFRTTTAQDFLEDSLKTASETFSGLASAAWQVDQNSHNGQNLKLLEESFAAAQWAWRTSAAKAISQMAARLGAGRSAIAVRVSRVQALEQQTRRIEQKTWKLMGDWSKALHANPEYRKLLQQSQAAANVSNRRLRAVRDESQRLGRQVLALVKKIDGAKTRDERQRLQAQVKALGARQRELSKIMGRSRQPVLDRIARMSAFEKQTPGYAAYRAQREKLEQQIRALGRQLRQARQSLRQDFPAYADLANPKPVTVAALQKLLRPGEALISFLFGERESFGWAITRQRALWQRLPLTRAQLEARVRDLRKGLSPVETELFRAAGGPAFDLQLSHSLYKALLVPLQPVLQDVRHIITVPSAALQSLPLAVLVTAPPKRRYESYQGYRAAPWLIRKYALTRLPSVPALKALRLFAKSGTPDQKPFIGFGDPLLTGPKGESRSAAAARQIQRVVSRGVRAGFVPPDIQPQTPATRSATSTTSAVNVDLVRQLYPLPDTADELRQIATTLQADPGRDLYLQDALREPRLHGLELHKYRVMSFATHGLVAGELPGLAEPALVLTPPDAASAPSATPPAAPPATDDGLLLASEIAQLRLNADWVLLSACNTAAGATPGGEGLSGLARAFFFAGARALLVSHWPVYSDAAVFLTTRIFKEQQRSREISRAEALRRSILALIADRSRPDNGHPSRWAPFVLVGDGAAK